jgi:WD40 repeat protein
LLLAKIYHQPDAERARKLECMVAHPLEDPMASQGHVSVAWPIDLLRDPNRRGQVVGFLMRRVNGLVPIVNFYNPAGRRKSCPLFNWLYLHQTARNLAAAFAAIHKRGDLVADVNGRNILVALQALVTLVDTDSFQVRDPGDGHIFRCSVGTAEYTPPELQNCDLGTVDREVQHDCFGLAVILFQLLMEGTHPFAGTFLGTGDPPPYEERIRLGHFPYSEKNKVPYRPMPIAPPFNILSPSLRHLFLRCFEDGHRNPAVRPDALTWQKALEEAETFLVPCTINLQHRYSKDLARCPWCERSQLLGGRDPFPSAQVVRRGQHLQPLPPRRSHVPTSPSPQSLFSRRGHGRTTLVIQTWRNVSSQWPRPALQQLRQKRTHLPPPNFDRHLARFVTAGFVIAAQFAQNWRSRSLYAGVALVAALGRKLLEWYPNLLTHAGIGYVGFTCLMVAGVITGRLLGDSPISLTVLLLLGFFGVAKVKPPQTSAPRYAIFVVLRCAIFAVCAFLGTLVVGTGGVAGTGAGTAPPQKSSLAQDSPTESLRTLITDTSSSIWTAAWSPNGKTIATANFGNTVSLWNAVTGKLESKLLQDLPAKLLAWSPDSKTLAAGNQVGTIQLWDIASGKHLVRLHESGAVTALAWSHDGAVLASASGRTITLWHGWRGSSSTINNVGEVTSLSWSPNSKLLVSGAWDGFLRVWDAASMELRAQSDRERAYSPIQAVSWSPYSTLIASGGLGGGLGNQVMVWNLLEEQKLSAFRTLAGHTGSIQSVAWAPDGSTLASRSDDRSVRLWDPIHGTQLRIIRDPEYYVQAAVWNPHGGALAVANVEKVKLWDVSR